MGRGLLPTLRLVARHGLDELRMKGYFASPQQMGTQFRPGDVAGYFNDLRHKRHWTGPFEDGVPHLLQHGGMITSPVMVFQYGLGAWDGWLAEQDSAGRDGLLAAARWAVDQQQANGGWRAWDHGEPHEAPVNDWSAMAQGQGISVLARAYLHTTDPRFLDAARCGAACMVRPIADGGTLASTANGPIFEELPTLRPNGILNGWIFALMGLHELLLVDPDGPDVASLHEVLEASLDCLSQQLPCFDRGYWSNYDLVGNVAKPFYHDLHIWQLEALAQTFPRHADSFRRVADVFRAQQRSRPKTIRAILAKIAQLR
ncbi:MAG: D-glucuronyl C5-epimerase family protein [Thermoplasmatota archaeon]